MQDTNELKQLMERFRQEDRIQPLDPEVAQEATRQMNMQMEEVRREYRRRERESQINAAKVVLTA
ncbi:hypothetical protein ACFSUS_21905 [Spirosoma soli]|uniref:Uncharacterized protein n=1 Tax=Spirosoma soli TaxID=1770529 RepID=A0ABW5M8L2_9BACT